MENIIDYLKNNKVLEKHINKYNDLLKKELINLSERDLLDIIFNSNIQLEFKLIVKEYIDSLDYERKIIINRIFDDIYSMDIYNLNDEFIPKTIKKHYIESLSNMRLKLFLSDYDDNYTDAILEYYYSNHKLDEILNLKICDKALDRLIDNYIKDINDIKDILSYPGISKEYQSRIIDKKINVNNIILFIQKLDYFFQIIDNIISERKDMIIEAINKLNKAELMELLYDFDTKKELFNIIYETRKNEIHDILDNDYKYNLKGTIFPYDKTNPYNHKYIFSRMSHCEKLLKSKNNDLSRHIYNKRKKAIFSNMNDNRLLDILSLEYIDNDIKDDIVSTNRKNLNNVIKNIPAKDIFIYYSRDSQSIPDSVIKEMVQIHKEELIDYISKNEKVNSLFLYGDRNKYFNELIINNILKNEEVFDLIKYVKNNNEKLEIVLEAKKDYIRECILNLKEGIFEFNLFSIEFFELKEMVIERNKDAVINCLKSLPNDILLKYFNNRVTLPIIKKYILTVINNFSEDDSHVIMLLLEKYELSYLIKIYPVVKNFILECNIDYNTFIQYGLGSIKYNNWFTDIIKIINDNKKDDFIKVLNYFNNNYYTNINDVSIIDNYLEIINRFNIYNDLIMNIINNNSLNDDLINDIKFLFKNDNIIYNLDLPKKISDIDKFKDKINSKFLNNINEDTTLMELIMIINKYILFDANLELDNIGGTEGLLSLKKSNSNSYKLCLLIDEMILYSKIIEKINNSSDKTSLLKFIKYLLNENNTNLKNIQNSFLSFSKKIKRLYEIEANTNLTKLDNIKNIDKVIDKNLSLKYGGSVYDFSDKNYVLMGHTISSKENIEDLIEGNSNGKSNFISVSAISYMGQRYYYNNDNLILAYDTLLEGSYVMGSTCNMGTNGLINDNSSEYEMVSINQRGLLETSAVTGNNSEILLYRKGLKPCGIILTNGREPRKEEALIHEKYNLPYILTQKSNTTINNPIRVFRENNYDQVIEKNLLSDKERNNLNNTLEVLNKTVKPKVYGREYTGREIGLFADAHSMFEPTIAILEDMKKQGISEIYSLGDNVGDGPEPDSLIDLLDYYGAKSIAGNSEYYNILGTEPFPYLDKERIENENWTKSKLGVSRIRKLKLYKPSIDLVVGNKRIALCHFANDIRYDFNEHSTWTFQDRKESLNPINQFLYTNSNESKIDMENIIKNGGNDPFLKGIIDAKNNPLFSGKQVIDYDAIIEGHTHFEYNDKLNDLNVYTLRAVGMGYKSKNDDNACYYILKEKVDGTFEIERKNVKYNKELLIAKIKSCGIPHNEKILRFINGK